QQRALQLPRRVADVFREVFLRCIEKVNLELAARFERSCHPPRAPPARLQRAKIWMTEHLSHPCGDGAVDQLDEGSARDIDVGHDMWTRSALEQSLDQRWRHLRRSP